LTWLYSSPGLIIMPVATDMHGHGLDVRLNEPGFQEDQFNKKIQPLLRHLVEAAEAIRAGREFRTEDADPAEQRSRELAWAYVQRVNKLHKIRHPDDAPKPAGTIASIRPGTGPRRYQLREIGGDRPFPFMIDAYIRGEHPYAFVSVRNDQGKEIMRVPMQRNIVGNDLGDGVVRYTARWFPHREGHYVFQVQVADADGYVVESSDFGHLMAASHKADLNPMSPNYVYGTVQKLEQELKRVHDLVQPIKEVMDGDTHDRQDQSTAQVIETLSDPDGASGAQSRRLLRDVESLTPTAARDRFGECNIRLLMQVLFLLAPFESVFNIRSWDESVYHDYHHGILNEYAGVVADWVINHDNKPVPPALLRNRSFVQLQDTLLRLREDVTKNGVRGRVKEHLWEYSGFAGLRDLISPDEFQHRLNQLRNHSLFPEKNPCQRQRQFAA